MRISEAVPQNLKGTGQPVPFFMDSPLTDLCKALD